MQRAHFVLTVLALLTSLPFFGPAVAALMSPLGGTPVGRWLFHSPLSFPVVLFTFYPFLLFSRMERYLVLGIIALGLGLAALVWLVVAKRRAAPRYARFWALTLALTAVIALPFLVPYRPAVEAAPGRALRMVERPGFLEGFVRACRAAAEVPGECQYEPLGWADAGTLVYRKWCGGRFRVDPDRAHSEWEPGIPGSPLAYSVATGRVTPFEGDPGVLHRQACDPRQCVAPGLVAPAGFPPPGYFSGQFGDPLLSPDGRRVAFTARHVYGPEDLLVLEGP